MQIVTEDFLKSGLKSLNHINKSQLVLLNESYPVVKGWKERVLGKQISDARAELFVLLQGVVGEKNQQAVIDNYKKLQGDKKAIDTVTQSRVKEEVLTSQNKEATQKSAACKEVKIYCDGGCVPNPGKSGSGLAVYHDGQLHELCYGLYDPFGTNNTAELNALHQSLLLAEQEVAEGNSVEILCDSMYSINCISVWAVGWEKKNWTKKGGEIKNLDIIKTAYALYNTLKKKIKLSHIKAHNGTEGNELADRMTIYTIQEQETAFKCYGEVIDISKILKMRAG